MYQIQEIKIKRNSESGMKFYNDIVKPYIDLLINEKDQNKLADIEAYINAEINLSIEDEYLIIRTDEDWTRVYDFHKGVIELDNRDYSALCNAFEQQREQLGDSVSMRYARRTMNNNRPDMNFGCVEVCNVTANQKLKGCGSLYDGCNYEITKAMPLDKLDKYANVKWFAASPVIRLNCPTGLTYDDECKYVPYNEEKAAEFARWEEKYLSEDNLENLNLCKVGDNEFGNDEITITREIQAEDIFPVMTGGEWKKYISELEAFIRETCRITKYVGWADGDDNGDYILSGDFYICAYSENFDFLQFCWNDEKGRIEMEIIPADKF